MTFFIPLRNVCVIREATKQSDTGVRIEEMLQVQYSQTSVVRSPSLNFVVHLGMEYAWVVVAELFHRCLVRVRCHCRAERSLVPLQYILR